MATEPVLDGQTSFNSGQDASKTPHFVAEDGYFSGVNVSNEDGLLKPRWGWQKIKGLKFPEGGYKVRGRLLKTFEEIFRTGKFQAGAPYSIGDDLYRVIVISGYIFLVNQRTKNIEVPTLEGQQMNPAAPRINWSPAGKYLVFFDFPNYPVILDGITVRRADPAKDEIPVSNIGGYNQNRLFIGNAGNEFTAGDPSGSLATPNAPISFEELLTITSPFFGQVFQLSTNYNNDPITAFAFLQSVDTGTGWGPLLVSTENAIYSYQTQNPRNTWETGRFGTLVVYNAGIVGPRAVVNINGDMFFISADGQFRSLSMSRDEQGKWSKTPLSREVHNWLIINSPELMEFSFVQYFKNKVFFSCNPYRVIARGLDNEPLPDYVFGGFAVLELDNVSTMTKQANPAWAGLWTGVRPMEMIINGETACVVSKDGVVNELYELRPDLTYDLDGDNIRYVKSKIYTKDYDFKSFFNNKTLRSVDFMLQEVMGDFEMTVKYKPDHGHKFALWRKFNHAAPWRSCVPPFHMTGLAGHYFKQLNLGSVSRTDCNPVTSDPYQNFRHVQLEITFEGIYWELVGFKLNADMTAPQNENITACNNFKHIPLEMDCSEDWIIGGFSQCLQRQT